MELSADEALAAGADRVSFDRPLPLYVDNFLGFPTGEAVPAGWYDFERAAWIPSDNGRIIELLAGDGEVEEEEGGGMAVLDVDGSGQPAGPDALAELGITDEERTTLAALYPVGATLWRVPVEHFTPWDCNWPWAAPQDATEPPETPPKPGDEDQPDPEDDCTQSGCIIQGLRQTLGEEIDLTGVPYGLHYHSDRVPGRRTSPTVTIPLSGSSIPASLRRISLAIEIAGQSFRRDFPAETNQTFVWQWDGLDGYGRRVNGTQTANIQVTYLYDLIYLSSSTSVARGFARFPDPQMVTMGQRGGSVFSVLTRSWKKQLGGFLPEDSGLGGWTPGIHHAYSPTLGLFGGDGYPSGTDSGLFAIIDSVFFKLSDEEGGGYLRASSSLAFDAGGNLYIADHNGNRVWRVDADGNAQRFAGTGDANYSGDGGPATEATLDRPSDLAIGADGSVYIADSGNSRIRRVAADGTISTVAGSGVSGYSGDGGPAVEAQFRTPSGVAVDSDGSFYIAELGSHRIRRVDPDGIITTVAGNGTLTPAEGDLGDGRPAIEAELAYPSDLAIGPDGSLYIVNSWDYRIRRVAPDGIISTVAGMGSRMDEYRDGMPATEAHLNPTGIFVSSDGVLYISEYTGKVRKVTQEGAITTVAGTGEYGSAGDGGPATRARLTRPADVALSPDGILYVADGVIRTVSPVVPDFGLYDILSPSPDATEVYHFDPNGRHLRTLDAITGAQLYAFAYTDDGLLHAITDRDGRTTTIERTVDGAPLAIVSPDGQRTALATDAGGYLSAVTDPAGNTHHMAYTTDGLMTAYTDPNGHRNYYTYDDLGRLTSDTDPLGGGWSLARDELDAGYQIAMTSAEGRTTTYLQGPLATGDRRRAVVGPDGTTLVTHFGTDGVEITDHPDGTQTTRGEEPDRRFGMLAPLTVTETTTPGGLTHLLAVEREVELAAPNDPLSLITLTETLTRNGRPVTDRYDAATRRWTTTTAEGRGATRDLDPLGRVVREQSDGLYPATYAYDAAGRLTGLTLGEAAEARPYALRYYADGPQAGFLEALTDPLGRETRFEYDPAGRLTAQTLADGRRIHYAYDPNGNLTALVPPGGEAHQLEYTAVDREAGYTPPLLDGAATVTRYTYDLDKQLTEVRRPDGQTLTLEYDGGGRLAALHRPAGTTAYQYDPATGHLTTITAPDDGRLAFTYDGPLPLGEQWSGAINGTVARAYNNDLRVVERSVNGDAVPFAYDADGLPTAAGDLTLTRNPANGLPTATALGAVTTARGYNGFGELTTERAEIGGLTLMETTYSHDALGRVTDKTESVDGITHTERYTYDPAGRLTEVERDGRLATYTYDANGNRLSREGPDGVENGSYDAQDRLISYGDADFIYTANGELTSRTDAAGTTLYAYDTVGNLTGVTTADGVIIDYLIDGRDRRIGKRVDGVLVQGFLYRDKLNPIAELDGDGNVVSRFVYGDKGNVPSYMVKGGATYRILSDHLGSPLLVVDAATGAVVQRMEYDEFGRVIEDTNPGFQPFGFAGGMWDRDTGLVRFGARDYDPRTGRWTAKDPIRFEGGDANLYAYVDNSPPNYIDPNGLRGVRPPRPTTGTPGYNRDLHEALDRLPDPRDSWRDPSNKRVWRCYCPPLPNFPVDNSQICRKPQSSIQQSTVNFACPCD